MRPRALFPLALAIGLGAVPAFAQPSFVGIWYSAFQPDEPGVISLIEFKADGTFYEEFRKCMNGEFVGYQYESGTWSVTDGVERVMVKMINGAEASVEDNYSVELLTDSERRIRMADHVFVSHRVAKFEFPNCPTGA
jgi:hypothetical protein